MPEEKTIFGFDEAAEKVHQNPKDYTYFGASLPREVLVESGDWRPAFPILEIQRNNKFDSYSCVSYANNNAEEMMHKARYGEEVNRSDRWLSTMSNTVPGRGNSHLNVAETKRLKGIVDEDKYPFTKEMTEAEFFQKPSKDLQELGIKIKNKRDYGYEKVRKTEFKEVLRYSPIQVAVDSRTAKADQFRGVDHSVVLTYIDDKGYGYIYDSYPNRPEKYDPDYPLSYGYRFHYKLKSVVEVGGYEMELVRDKSTGQIYFCDSDNRLHWCEAPTDFTEFFGKHAWENQKWTNLTAKQISHYEKGLTISANKRNVFDKVHDLFKDLGSKK